MHVYVCNNMQVEFRGQFSGFWELNSGHQPWWQTSLTSEPSCWPFIPALGLKKECRVQRSHSLGLCISSDDILVSVMIFYNGKLIMALDS